VRRSRPPDTLVLAATAVVLLALLVARHAAGWLGALAAAARGALHHIDPLLVVPAVLLAAAVAVARAVVTRRTLRSRVRLVALASETFDPSLDAVLRFASELARLRPTVRGWLDRRARALRILLESDPTGRLRYTLEVPAQARELLRTAMGIYAEVELRDPEPAPAMPATAEPAAAGSAGLKRVRAELVLARPSSEPLARLALDPDPLQGLAAALAGVRPELGDGATVTLDLLPCTPGERRRQRRRHARRTAHRQGNPAAGKSLLELLAGGPARGPAAPSVQAQRRVESRALAQKLWSGEPLFELQLLVRCQSRVPGRAKALLQGVLASFDAFAGENHLRVSGPRIPAVAFIGSDLPLRRGRFDRRLDSGLFRPARRGLVTPSEIAGLLKPPTIHCRAANVERSGGSIPPPPPELPEFRGQPGLIPLGRVAGPGGERLAGVPAAETFFSYMAGRSRYGKTETAIGQFVHLVRAGHGGLFLDPHADAIAEIKTYLTDPPVANRVIELDLADRGPRQRQPGWNLFAIHGLTTGQAADRVDAVVDALASTLRWDERNTRALNLATQGAQALVELAHVLPVELAPTIFQLPTLLSNDQWRAAVLPHLAPATRQFFTDRFPRLPAEAVTAVTNLIDRLRAARPVAALLGAPVSTYDVRKAMDDGLIVLACPGSGSTRDRLVANFIVYDVLHAAKARASLPPARRRPFWVFLDELQTYDGPNLPMLLEQSAKYGGRAFLFNQTPERLSEATLNAVTTNRSHLLTTTVNAKAAGLLAREWGGDPTPQTVTQLARYTYLASVTLGERTTKPFLVHGVPARELHAAHRHPDRVRELDHAIDETSNRRPVSQTLAALDGHDQRIREHLERQASGQEPGVAGVGGEAPAAGRTLQPARVAHVEREDSE
jgi:hypothetical protein